MMGIRGAIFDLDGVLVDTAKYHYLAWKKLSQKLEIPFTENDNERLKGISREQSLDILLAKKNKIYSMNEKQDFMIEKNKMYIEYISQIDKNEVLPGVFKALNELKSNGVKIALGSASKNAKLILEKTNLIKCFDAIVDGNDVLNAKPNPEIFLLGSKKLEVAPEDCIVFEDAEAGVQAGKSARMFVIGIGDRKNLKEADVVVNNLLEVKFDELLN